MGEGAQLFLPPVAWQDRLLAHYEANPDFIAPASRRNEVLSFVSGGLHDLSVSRTSFRWGIPVPGDPAHVMYVWLDALTNYLTAVGYPGRDGAGLALLAGRSASGRQGHPALPRGLLAGLPDGRRHAPPQRVFAHGWWTVEGEKMSKSLGNVIDPAELVGDIRAGCGAVLPAARSAVRQ